MQEDNLPKNTHQKRDYINRAFDDIHQDYDSEYGLNDEINGINRKEQLWVNGKRKKEQTEEEKIDTRLMLEHSSPIQKVKMVTAPSTLKIVSDNTETKSETIIANLFRKNFPVNMAVVYNRRKELALDALISEFFNDDRCNPSWYRLESEADLYNQFSSLNDHPVNTKMSMN